MTYIWLHGYIHEAQDSGMNIWEVTLVKGINRRYCYRLFVPLTKVTSQMFIPESWASHNVSRS